MHDFTRLRVWKRARVLTAELYGVTSRFPPAERLGLTAQIRRSVVSVGANLAEGAGRSTARDFARFASNALGSLNELEHHLFVAADLGYIPDGTLAVTREEIGVIRAMTVRLRRSLLDEE